MNRLKNVIDKNPKSERKQKKKKSSDLDEIYELLKGVLVQKIYIFKELAPRSRTYELRGQGKK